MSSEPSKLEREPSQVPANPKEDPDTVQLVPPPQEEESAKREIQQPELFVAMEAHAGPMPHPSILRGYDDVLPGTAKRVVDNWERESEFRRNVNRQTEVVIPRRGQIFAFKIVVLAWGVSVCAIILGNTWQGFGFFLATLVSAVSAMIWGRKS